MRDLIDDLRVFRVPVKFTVSADLCVLATNALDARTQAIKIDLEPLIDLVDTSVIPSDECLLEFTNHDTPTIEPGEPTPIPHDEYDPSDHPDFDEDLHCIDDTIGEERTDDESDYMDDAARERSNKGPFTS